MSDSDLDSVTDEWRGNEPGRSPDAASTALPDRIGRYQVERILGHGGFGVVYLAHDGQLDRLVAIKVPRADLVKRHPDIEAYLAEARTLASLDYANIVPVHDVGTTEKCPCFIVSKYVEGTDLAAKIKDDPLSHVEASQIVATIADALHYAHTHGIVHRDVKPANILIDRQGKPFLADFGLALRDQDNEKGPIYAGSPTYMSPEQARGEGHRVDGRSDIFSLGAVFYELLVGRSPFHTTSRSETLERILHCEPRPPRQIDDNIPKQLEVICLKALSKEPSNRYTTASDFADEIRRCVGPTSRGHPAPNAITDSPGGAAKVRRVSLRGRLGRLGCWIELSLAMSILLAMGDLLFVLSPVVQYAREAYPPDPTLSDRIQSVLIAGFHVLIFSTALLGVVWFSVKLLANLGRIASRVASSVFRR